MIHWGTFWTLVAANCFTLVAVAIGVGLFIAGGEAWTRLWKHLSRQ